jgi:hypothetical protein
VPAAACCTYRGHMQGSLLPRSLAHWTYPPRRTRCVTRTGYRWCAARCTAGGATVTQVAPYYYYYYTSDTTATSSTTSSLPTFSYYHAASTTATSGLDGNGDSLLSKLEFETAMLEASLSGL